MIVAIDASILLYLIDDAVPAPIDPATNAPVADCRARVKHLVTTLGRGNGKIIIPTPALAEVLIRAGEAGPEWLRLLNASRHFRIVPFDQRAAVECAALGARRLAGSGAATTPRWKAKFDEQIVAIAAVERATSIYSDDTDIARLVAEGITVIGIAALPLPPLDAQLDLLEPLSAEMATSDAPLQDETGDQE